MAAQILGALGALGALISQQSNFWVMMTNSLRKFFNPPELYSHRSIKVSPFSLLFQELFMNVISKRKKTAQRKGRREEEIQSKERKKKEEIRFCLQRKAEGGFAVR